MTRGISKNPAGAPTTWQISQKDTFVATTYFHFRRSDDDLLGPPSSLWLLGWNNIPHLRLIQNSPTPLLLREMLDPGLLVKLTNHALVDGT